MKLLLFLILVYTVYRTGKYYLMRYLKKSFGLEDSKRSDKKHRENWEGRDVEEADYEEID